MREEIIKVYRFNELSESAQKFAIEKGSKSEYENLSMNSWVDCNQEYYQGKTGFKNIKISYSLSCCQGDGASIEFENTMLSELNFENEEFKDIKNIMDKFEKEIKSLDFLLNDDKKTIIEDMGETEVSSYRNNTAYYHWNSTCCETVEFNDRSYWCNYDNTIPENCIILEDLIENLETKIEECITKVMHSIGKELENSGYAEIEYRTGEETIKGNIISNEYEFTSNGEMY